MDNAPATHGLAIEARESFERLIRLIEGKGLEEQSLGEAWKHRRGADVVAHLHAWHELFCGWWTAAEAGVEPVMPAPGHSWEDLTPLNDEIYERYRDTPWEEIVPAARASMERMLDYLAPLSDAQLSDPDAFPWAGRPLASIVRACLAEHYAWGIDCVSEAV